MSAGAATHVLSECVLFDQVLELLRRCRSRYHYEIATTRRITPALCGAILEVERGMRYASQRRANWLNQTSDDSGSQIALLSLVWSALNPPNEY